MLYVLQNETKLREVKKKGSIANGENIANT